MDLDTMKVRNILRVTDSNEPQRADCFIIYAKMTAIMEVKTSYPEKAIPQLKKTAELLKLKWNEFLKATGLGADIPRPSAYYFCTENGIGHSRYEVDHNNILREKSKAGRDRGPIQYAEDSIPIKVFNKKEIDNLYNIYRE
ncbi:MAG: hypothetical protein QW292_03130 [Candidatus Parvarchaeota archaeon]